MPRGGGNRATLSLAGPQSVHPWDGVAYDEEVALYHQVRLPACSQHNPIMLLIEQTPPWLAPPLATAVALSEARSQLRSGQ